MDSDGEEEGGRHGEGEREGERGGGGEGDNDLGQVRQGMKELAARSAALIYLEPCLSLSTSLVFVLSYLLLHLSPSLFLPLSMHTQRSKQGDRL